MTQSTTLTRAISLPAIDQHRRITHRTRGHGHGPIVRLMSPSDLGEIAKPFVFLDLFEADMRSMRDAMALHPHSDVAIATAKMKLTVLASASAGLTV
jgi:redox-sensitive bicupin YhaK (pirin superfamily)